MARNYEKEAEWAKNKYSRIYIKFDKELGEKFKAKVKENGETINQVIKEFVEEYINK